MILRTYLNFIPLCFFVFALVSCPDSDKDGGKTGDNLPATVYFHNESRYKVEIYKNFNPDYFDSSTWVCTLERTGATEKVTLYPSADQKIGDIFYPRYKLLLADSYDTGTTNIYADAQWNRANIPLVVESGGSYTRSVPDASPGELNFIYGYIIVQNMENTSIQIINGDEILPKEDDKTVYINAYRIGYYKIPFTFFDNDNITMNHLKAFGTDYVSFPTFVMKKGKKYSFKMQDGIITGPVEKNIWD